MRKSEEIVKISPTVLRELRTELADVLKEFGEKRGITLELKGGMQYTEDSFSVRLQGVIGTDSDPKKMEFERYAPAFGIPADWYGQNFLAMGAKYEVSGISPRSRKYPILARDMETGKEYKFTLEAVRQSFRASI